MKSMLAPFLYDYHMYLAFMHSPRYLILPSISSEFLDNFHHFSPTQFNNHAYGVESFKYSKENEK